ncbi:Fur family transcriptional regulator [Microlunatus soli]|uniref:Zinc uptake regulator, Fur family n=1 Tax=Microlunatus soli TaxID=630515 RepID=A0A1H1YUJ9_9ACTN|nr:Fur family transcriptional regulator [Microlunatus soli]SDT25083.1 zinc uptake regulator, Fur family [Microlunatus soli]
MMNQIREPESAAPQRRTRQRAAVDKILNAASDFRSAQQIHDELRHSEERVGLTTVYRTLQSMTDSGELDAIRNVDGEMSYRRCSGGHHHHLVCRSCGRTVEVSGPTVEKWANSIATEHGFRDVNHELEIFGTCSSC